ncbi:flagellin [Vreelandella populi]|uniref:flagellin n=1 Tax=Vreelandella populi TaxID=2498858 RepID=UPI000F8D3EB0|nr:hypothetical protein ELY40_02845 [Halomonas populi]
MRLPLSKPILPSQMLLTVPVTRLAPLTFLFKIVRAKHGIPRSTVNLTEVDQDIRLRTPPNPSLAALDQIIAMVDSKRGYLGALENRSGSVIENNLNTNINLSAARSCIQDADYATEASNMIKAPILQQAGTSVLAQANQIPQSVLSLLN